MRSEATDSAWKGQGTRKGQLLEKGQVVRLCVCVRERDEHLFVFVFVSRFVLEICYKRGV